MRRVAALIALVALSLNAVSAPAAAAEKIGALCASRIYDFLHWPVGHFAIDSGRTQLISPAEYARYKQQLEDAAEPLGFDPVSTAFTLHESLSAFPFLNRGIIREVILVLCAAGLEKDNICRRADYYLYDAVIDPDRLADILSDILRMPQPAPVDACDFGQGDWAALEP